MIYFNFYSQIQESIKENMEGLRKEREDLNELNLKLRKYKDKLQVKYGKMREDFLLLGEENKNKNRGLESQTLNPITVKRISKVQKNLDVENSKYFKELLQGPLDVKINYSYFLDFEYK